MAKSSNNRKSKRAKNVSKSSKSKIKNKSEEFSLETYDFKEESKKESKTDASGKKEVSHDDIDSEIEDLRRRVLEEEEDAKFVEDDSAQRESKSKKSANSSGLGSALFELLPGLLLGTLGIGHLHNRKFVKGFLIMVCYWAFLTVETYILFNIFAVIELSDFAALSALLAIINLLIIFISTHSAYHEIND